jgi:hypothetical protein
MATIRIGTTANNSLTPALKFLRGYNSGMSAADIAAVALAVKNDQINTHPVYPEAFSANGILYVPNRGFLSMLPGDYVAVDSTGWPILLSSLAATTGPWTLS